MIKKLDQSLLRDIFFRVTDLQQQAADIHIHPEKYGINRDIILKESLITGEKIDYTSRVDQVIEAKLKPQLLELLPNSGFLGEETESSGMDKRFRWIMDPTDGTAVYTLGGEYYSNSLALIDLVGNNGNGAVILGSVYQSAKSRQFGMIKDKTFIIEHIQTYDPKSIIEKLPEPSQSRCFAEYLGCSFGTSEQYKYNPGIEDRLKKVFEKQEAPFLNKSYSMLNARPASGSSALFCCDIADGNRHFALLFYQKGWDVAVGAVYAQRVGCPIVLFDNKGNVIDGNLETSIAQCDKKTLLNVGVFGNKYIRDDVLKKFNSI
jgi:fructose-1,6-bisphosphatase/inositol monophosphatase family enzyme